MNLVLPPMVESRLQRYCRGNKIFMYVYEENSAGNRLDATSVVAFPAVKRGRVSTALSRDTIRS